jgi:predicted MFS family arabinose efflux permease
VFILAFALLLSDYMSRQVLSSVFPLLKSEWALSDSRLASLSSIVALMVGLLTFPLSLVADRWGRVKSLVLMATMWSVATLLCAVATNYGELLGARLLVGVGEAAYGSVGIAVVLSVFAPSLRASLSGAFMAGGSFGAVIGVALGGVIAVHLGWRWSFAAMGILGLLLVALYWVTVTEGRLARYRRDDPSASGGEAQAPDTFRAPISSLFSTTSVICAYIGSGLQLFVAAVLLSWMPSFFNRYYGMAPDKAGGMAAIFAFLIATGMISCGVITDRVSRHYPARKWSTSICYCGVAAVFLIVGFQFAPGPAQLVLIGCGAFFSAGTSGPAVAIVADLTHPTVRASAFGTLTVSNSLIGLALAPFAIGLLADRLGLSAALQLAPIALVAAAAVLLAGRRDYPAGLRRLASLNRPPSSLVTSGHGSAT